MLNLKPSAQFGRRLVAAALGAALLASACGSPASPTAAPTATAPAATSVPSPAPTRVSTPTPAPLTRPQGIVQLVDWIKYSNQERAQAQPRKGGTLSIGTIGEAPHQDLLQTGGVAALIPRKPAFDNLIRFSPFELWKIEGDLAESWDISADGKRYTFRLRQGVKWHDGNAFGPADVAFTFNARVSPPKGVTPQNASLFVAFDRAEVAGPNEVAFIMKQPSAAFFSVIATDQFPVLPKHIYDSKGDMKAAIVGTGPFMLAEHKRDEVMRLDRNPNYFKPNVPHLDAIDIMFIPDRGTRFAAFRTGRTLMTQTAAQALDAEQAKTIATRMVDQATVVEHGGWVPVMNRYNHLKPPYNDVRVRRALDLAINRYEVIEAIGQGTVGGALHPMGPWGIPLNEITTRPGYRQDKTADIAEAKRLLAEAGFTSGLAGESVVRTGPRTRALEVMKEQYKAIGFTLNIKQVVEPSEQDQITKSGKFDMSFIASGLAMDDPDLALNGGGFYSKADNAYGFKDAQIDQWYEAQTVEMDSAKRRALAIQIQNRILELVPHTVIYWDTYYRGWWHQVRGYMPYPGPYINLKNDTIWLDRR